MQNDVNREQFRLVLKIAPLMVANSTKFGYLLQEALDELDTVELAVIDRAAKEINECIWNTGALIDNV